jgi:metal-responsive CopG/Arc/MetJ family transcriptional regulator
MGTLTLRLPEKLDQQLSQLAELSQLNRSEVARAALEKYLHDRERERLLGTMAEAFRLLATNPQAHAESMAIADDFAVADNEALAIAEGRKPYDADPDDEQWWR